MNLDVLDETLRTLGIPPELVSLGTTRDAAWCLVPHRGGWEVFWSAAGSRHAHIRLDSEAVACYYLLGKLVHDQVLAGQLTFPD